LNNANDETNANANDYTNSNAIIMEMPKLMKTLLQTVITWSKLNQFSSGMSFWSWFGL